MFLFRLFVARRLLILGPVHFQPKTSKLSGSPDSLSRRIFYWWYSAGLCFAPDTKLTPLTLHFGLQPPISIHRYRHTYTYQTQCSGPDRTRSGKGRVRRLNPLMRPHGTNWPSIRPTAIGTAREDLGRHDVGTAVNGRSTICNHPVRRAAAFLKITWRW